MLASMKHNLNVYAGFYAIYMLNVYTCIYTRYTFNIYIECIPGKAISMHTKISFEKVLIL